MTRFIAYVAFLAVVAQTAVANELPLAFNGKNLVGWKAPENNLWFRADEGILRVKSGPKKQGATLWTAKDYENFIMEFDFKFGPGTVDTGIYVRNEREQIQIGISGSLKRDMTGSPYIAGKGYPVEAKGVKQLLKLTDWNSMTIVAKGNQYAVWLNGKLVMTYESESAIEKGPVGIQLHGNREMAVDYRDIRLAALH